MEKDKVLHHLDQAIDERVPDAWDQIQSKLMKAEVSGNHHAVIPGNFNARKQKAPLSRKLSYSAAAFVAAAMVLVFTPAMAAVQELYDKLFDSSHIDDTGLKAVLKEQGGQILDEKFYDKANDVTVHFQSVMTDEKETKLLVTYESKKTNLANYYLDIFEGDTSIYLIDAGGQKKKLHFEGWGSRHYDKGSNKVAQALSFASIKEFEGKEVKLQIENLTFHGGNTVEEARKKTLKTAWPLAFKLDKSAVSSREAITLNKEFAFNGETYMIEQVEFSAFETRVVMKGTDIKPYVDESGEEFDTMSKLENELLSARKFEKGFGYSYDPKKDGVVLEAGGVKAVPIFSKGELPSPLDEYHMSFEPIKERKGVVLKVGKDIKIPLTE